MDGVEEAELDICWEDDGDWKNFEVVPLLVGELSVSARPGASALPSMECRVSADRSRSSAWA